MINVTAPTRRVPETTFISFRNLADPLLQPLLDPILTHQLPLLTSLIDDLQEVVELRFGVLGFPDSLLVLEFFNQS